MRDLRARFRTRAAHHGLTVSDPLETQLLTYFELLHHWNRKINLTSLSEPDKAIDRLLLEPVAAAKYLPSGSRLADLGSGGGSPAIPLAMALPAVGLLMVESRSRKAAFLREVVRELGFDATVVSGRFEAVARQSPHSGSFQVVSVRAVRPDQATLAAAAGLLATQGVVALFRGREGPDEPPISRSDLAWRETRPLLGSPGSRLTVLFHVEHS